MNYFIEGLQGSGKSTLVKKLSEMHPEYLAVHEGDYSPEKLASSRDVISIFDQGEILTGIVHVYDLSDRECTVYKDVANEHLMITYS